MTDRQRCPLCGETYDERTDLRVHLEVEHRKSEIVSSFVDLYDAAESPVDGDPMVADEERPAPSAD